MEAGSQIMENAIASYYCPSRRPPIPIPHPSTDPHNNSDNGDVTGATDYAANMGDLNDASDADQPKTFEEADDPNFDWDYFPPYTGITGIRSEFKFAKITDGTANTYMVGEKYLNPDNYFTGISWGEDDGAFTGQGYDHSRWCRPDDTPPMQDQPGAELLSPMGSAHSSGFHVVFCDGSVHVISYAIDPLIHAALANREDGFPVDIGSL